VTDAGLAPGAIRLRDVSRKFKVVHERSATLKETLIRRNRSRHTELWALRDVSFDIKPGESVALVGRNGSGKSTLLKMLAGIIPPHSGTIDTGGSVASMLELGSGFHPDFTGRENVFMNGAIHGLSERTVRTRLDEIIEFAELRDYIDMPVRTYSSGMQMRLAFAVAAHVSPDILLLDEVLAVGDAAFQAKCIGRIEAFQESGGTLVFVSHSAAAVREICDRAILMDSGVVRADGPTTEVIWQYEDLVARGQGHAGGEFVADGPAASETGASAPMHSRAEITGLETFLDGAGAPGGVVSGGDTIRIAVTYRADPDLPPLDIAVHLTDESAHDVIGICSSEANLRLPREGGAFTCTTELVLPLQEGLFSLTAFVKAQGSGEVLAHFLSREPLRVARVFPGQGIIAAESAWSVQAAHVDAVSGR
jgi:ABC-type polysaccharide/polyol phosphate transport system ATPase subunit